MKTNDTYIKLFDLEDDAYGHMLHMNRVNRVKHLIYCLTAGPENNFAVTDLNTAIELGAPYSWTAI